MKLLLIESVGKIKKLKQILGSEWVLPDFIQSEFTVAMEAELDAIAAGKKNWEHYLINWNTTYFAPALAAAYRSLGASPGLTSWGAPQAEVTDLRCPKCDRPMNKIKSSSKKLFADRFLKCSNQECGTAMFWSDQKQAYELPYSERQDLYPNGTSLSPNRNTNSFQATAIASTITDCSCPMCDKPLELYEYTKENQKKQMLRCSDAQARRRDERKDAVFFTSKGVFLSPKYGEISSMTKPKKLNNNW